MSESLSVTALKLRCERCAELYPSESKHQCALAPGATDGGEPSKLGLSSLLGAVLGDRYAIESEISQGGMGVVYKAQDLLQKTPVAVKILRTAQPLSGARRRFLAEARLLSRLKHPNIVSVTDFGVLPDSRLFLVMEYLLGSTLGKVLKGGRMDPLRACKVALQIVRGLHRVHADGIVHRDLKPDNVFLIEKDGNPDFVKIIDFGIAKSTITDDELQPSPSKSGTSEKLPGIAEQSFSSEHEKTKPGTAIGSPRYMAPEQVRGAEVDGRTDQYAIGCMLYQMLCGSVPFDGQLPVEVMMMHIGRPVQPLRQRTPELRITSSLEQTVLRMLGKTREERFPSLREVDAALQREIRRLEPGLSRRQLWSLFAVGLLLVLLPVAYLGYGALERYKKALRPGELAKIELQARTVLREQTTAKSPELRRGALLALSLTHDSTLRPLFEQALADPLQRATAIEALGQLGDAKAAQSLAPLLNSEGSPELAITAARSLVELGDERGNAALIRLLESPAEATRLSAALTLCERGNAAAQQEFDLARGKSALLPLTLLNILYCQARAGQTAARSELLSRLGGGTALEVQLDAAAKLLQLDEPAGRVFLKKLAATPGPAKLQAARLLAAADEPAVAELFRHVLSDSSATLPARLYAAEGLGLTEVLLDGRLLALQLNPKLDPQLRQAAATAIIRLSQDDPRILSAQSLRWARAALGEPSTALREAGVAVLGDVPSSEVLPLLTSMLDDGEPQVRRGAARALGRRPEPQALAALRQGLRDSDAQVRLESLRALGRVMRAEKSPGGGGVLEQAVGWFAGLLKDGTPSDQAVARSILFSLGDKAQGAELRRLATAGDAELKTLLAAQDGADLELLASLLVDESAAVRFRAARTLAERQDARAIPVLKEVLGKGGTEAIVAYGLLVSLGQKAAAPAIEGVLLQAKVDDRKALIEASTHLPLELALPLLRREARDNEPLLRRLVAETISELPETGNGPPGLDILRILKKDSYVTVRVRAEAVFARLGAISEQRPAQAKPEQSASALNPATPTEVPVAVDGGAASKPPGAAGTAETPPSQGPIDDQEAATAPLNAAPIEALVRSGLAAFERQDLRKAQRLLDKAEGLCARDHKHVQACANLTFELAFRLAHVYETDERLSQAMAAYQKLSEDPGASTRGTAEQRVAIHEAMLRLAPRLGQVILAKRKRGKCQESKLWLPPGTQRIEVNGKTQTILVRARETVQVGTCP